MGMKENNREVSTYLPNNSSHLWTEEAFELRHLKEEKEITKRRVWRGMRRRFQAYRGAFNVADHEASLDCSLIKDISMMSKDEPCLIPIHTWFNSSFNSTQYFSYS